MRARKETATLTDVFSFGNLGTNQMYYDYDLDLRRSLRASIVARAYREFRITKVKYMFKPQVDTFAAGGVTAVPTLYYVIDKTASLEGAITPLELRSAGARPKRLDDKIVSVSYKPSVLQFARDASVVAPNNAWSMPKTSPWLATNAVNDDEPAGGGGFAPNTIDHLGLIWYVEAGGDHIFYQLDVVVEYEFRKPQYEQPAFSTLGLPKGIQVTVPELIQDVTKT